MTSDGPRSICVFCASSRGRDERLLAAAHDFGWLLASRGQRLVYGGGRVGLMGALADGALAGGGEVVGVIPEAMVGRELAHEGITDLRVVESMHERKATMAELSDAFVALPGGLGTLEEFFEVLTWAQLGLHRKPCGLLNVSGYFDGLLTFADHAAAEGFVRREHREMMFVADTPVVLLDRMARHQPPVVEKWIDRAAT